MKVSERGKNIIKEFEGLRLEPYLCKAGVPTIGYGNTFYPNGKKVTLKDKPITKEEADQLFNFLISMFESDVNKLLGTIKVSQNQFDALLDFAYNLGTDIDADDIPEGLGDSTLLKKVKNNPNDPSIGAEFMKWNKAKGRAVEGLTRRRKAEAYLYFSNN